MVVLQDEKYETMMLGKLTEKVQCLICNTVDTGEMLELLDNMETLGLAYLFEHEIKKVLDTFVSNHNLQNNLKGENNLYNTALLFSLLRKHGYHVTQGTHIPFTQSICFVFFFLKYQIFMFCNIFNTDMFADLVDINTHSDVKAMLKLFEASHLGLSR